jgi:hypothetical protein
MNNYIEANCEFLPLNKPRYSEDSGLWCLWFPDISEEHCPWAYSVIRGQEPIPVFVDTYEEAKEIYNHYKEVYRKNKGDKINEEDNS